MKTSTLYLSCILLFWTTLCFAKVPKVWNIDTTTTIVTGRETELSDIHTSLNKENNDTEILTITGLPGYGKTEITKAYAKIYKEEYDVCWFFDSKRDLFPQFIEFSYQWNKAFPNNQIIITQNKQALLKEMKEVFKKANADMLFILDNINSQKESITNFKNALRTSNSNWLIIFDNTSSFDFIKDFLPAHHTKSKGHVLITSQNNESWPNVYRLHTLNEASIRRLFNVAEADQAKLGNIAQALKYHPFAIYQMYKEMHSQKYSFQDYLNMLQAFKSPMALDPAIKMTQMHISKFISENNFGPEFIELLYFMDNNFIPDYLLKLFWKKMGHIDAELNSLISEASKCLILDPLQQTGEGIKFYKYHDIVKSTLEKIIIHEKQTKMAQLLASFISYRTEIDQAPYLEDNFSHKVPIIENIVFVANQFNKINSEISDLYLDNVEYFALYTREFHKCIKFIMAHENINKFISTVAPQEQTVRFHTTLSGIYWWLGDHKQGLIHEKSAEKISKDIKMTKSLQFERILNYATSHYLFLGEQDKALEYIMKLQALNNGKIDDDKFDTTNLIDLNHLSYFNLIGDYQKSMALADKIFSRISGKASKRFLYYIPAYTAKYESYMYLTDPTLSLDEIMNTITKLSEALGDQHRMTAKTRVLLAGHLINHGKVREAKEILLKQLPILDNWFGKQTPHKEKALALSLLGDCFYKEKNYLTAKNYYELSREQYHKGFTNLRNNEVRRILIRVVAVNVARNESLMIHKLLAEYRNLFGKDKQYDKLIIHLTTKKHLELSDL